MCGISGFCDFSKNFKKEPVLWEQILTDMHHTLAHRGSDSFGTYLDTHVGLSHARLSIRDIAGGSQPMIRQDGGRTCAIVYNGEIYNTDELLPPLLAARVYFFHHFRHGSHSLRLSALWEGFCQTSERHFCLCDLGRQNRRTAFVP